MERNERREKACLKTGRARSREMRRCQVEKTLNKDDNFSMCGRKQMAKKCFFQGARSAFRQSRRRPFKVRASVIDAKSRVPKSSVVLRGEEMRRKERGEGRNRPGVAKEKG